MANEEATAQLCDESCSVCGGKGTLVCPDCDVDGKVILLGGPMVGVGSITCSGACKGAGQISCPNAAPGESSQTPHTDDDSGGT